jgi:hypothetical protein
VDRNLTSAIFTSPGLSNGAGISPAVTAVEKSAGSTTLPPSIFSIDLLNIFSSHGMLKAF